MSSAITKIDTKVFQVDFKKLHQELKTGIQRLIPSRGPVEVDPYLIGNAVRTVMQLCRSKDVHGRRLAWNEYKVFLSNQDSQDLEALKEGLQAGLDTLIQDTLSEMQADMVGDPLVRILVDEANAVSKGIAEITVDFVKNFQMKAPVQGEVTVRLQRGVASPAFAPHAPPVQSYAAQNSHSAQRPHGAPPNVAVPTTPPQTIPPQVAPSPIAPPTAPQANLQPPPPGSVRLCWGAHEIVIPAGQKVTVGRPHPQPPDNFVGLEGASKRISSLHLALENVPTGVVISRPAEANPLEVEGRPVQRGGKRLVEQLPVKIKLSNGEMVLQLLPRSGS